jgi:hypothetical protein
MQIIDRFNSRLSEMPVTNPQVARLLCRLIPSACPFERDIRVLGWVQWHIPPLCKLNPLYDGLMALRFHALSYLTEQCGENCS